MKDHVAIRQRYLRDGLPVRLGNLAANLARIKSFSDQTAHRDVVESLLEESKFFIEWTALDAPIEVQTALVALQRRLALWHLRWEDIWEDVGYRRAVAEEAGEWSKRVLAISGLLP